VSISKRTKMNYESYSLSSNLGKIRLCRLGITTRNGLCGPSRKLARKSTR